MPNEFENPQSRLEAIRQNMLGADNQLQPPASRLEELDYQLLDKLGVMEHEIETAIVGALKPSGSVAFANLPSLTSSNLNNLYNVTDAFTTTSDFTEGAGKAYPAGTNVAIINIGTNESPTLKYDAMVGLVDLSSYALKSDVNAALADKQDTLTFDSTPTASSTNPVTSGGVKSAIDGISVPSASDSDPLMDGTKSAGSATTYSRSDHVHPSDTSKITAPQSPTQGDILEYDGSAWVAMKYFYTLTVTAVTQDGVTVTGQTVTIRENSADGDIFATAEYEGQPVSFSLPNGFVYYVEITDTLASHFNPSKAHGIISGANASVILTYSDFSSIATIEDVQAALNADLDLTSLVGLKTIHNNANTLEFDILNYSSANKDVDIATHETLPDQMQFDAPQALKWCEDGLAAGPYTFKNGTTDYYFTLTQAIPEGGQLRATPTAFSTYASPDSTSSVETGTVSTTEISGATSLGACGTGDLNHMDRVNYGSNNCKESGLIAFLNSADPAGTVITGSTKFSRPHTSNKAGFLTNFDANELACIADTNWKCNTNNVYEAPASVGGTTTKQSAYTFTAKFCLLSEKEVFGSYGGTDDGSSLMQLFVNATADDRKRYYNNTARSWLLRSPVWDYALHERNVGTSGEASLSGASGSNGVVPACKIRKQSS